MVIYVELPKMRVKDDSEFFWECTNIAIEQWAALSYSQIFDCIYLPTAFWNVCRWSFVLSKFCFLSHCRMPGQSVSKNLFNRCFSFRFLKPYRPFIIKSVEYFRKHKVLTKLKSIYKVA